MTVIGGEINLLDAGSNSKIINDTLGGFGMMLAELIAEARALSPPEQLQLIGELSADQSRGDVSPLPSSVPMRSVAQAFGLAARLRTGDEISAQIRDERNEWGDR